MVMRLQDNDLQPFYKSLGDFLKKRCQGAQAFVYFGKRELLKHMGLKPSWKKPLRNAGSGRAGWPSTSLY
jgi:putative N6-adenine-specific DNA methylase